MTGLAPVLENRDLQLLRLAQRLEYRVQVGRIRGWVVQVVLAGRVVLEQLDHLVAARLDGSRLVLLRLAIGLLFLGTLHAV